MLLRCTFFNEKDDLAEVSLLLMDIFWHVRAADGIGIVSEFSQQATSNHSVARAGGYAL